jgi:hypothetical protein
MDAYGEVVSALILRKVNCRSIRGHSCARRHFVSTAKPGSKSTSECLSIPAFSLARVCSRRHRSLLHQKLQRRTGPGSPRASGTLAPHAATIPNVQGDLKCSRVSENELGHGDGCAYFCPQFANIPVGVSEDAACPDWLSNKRSTTIGFANASDWFTGRTLNYADARRDRDVASTVRDQILGRSQPVTRKEP